MKYQVSELLADKALRDSIIEEAFDFTDEYNDFFAVDFSRESWRYNHITVFEVLYSLGGDELFEKLIAAGGTCLTKDPNAAKVGVQPVGGAEGYYLKTNASAGVAFLSILNGFAGLGDDERFSFYVAGYSTAALRVADKEYNYCTQYEYSCNYEVREQEDGRYVIYDCEEETDVAFCIVTNKVEEEISSFYALEPLYKHEDSLLDDGKTLVAYRYKIDADSKWGMINANLSQITPHIFDQVYVTDKNLLIAGQITSSTEYGEVETDVFFEKYSYGCGENILDVSRCYVIEGLLQDKGYIDIVTVDDEREFIYYNTSNVATKGHDRGYAVGYAFFDKCDGFNNSLFISRFAGNKVSMESGFIVGKGSSRMIPAYDEPGYNFTPGAKAFYKLYSEEAPEHKAVQRLCDGKIYKVERDGYYAVASYRDGEDGSLEFYELLTPYAFTGIKCVDNKYFILDCFGKKGVFDKKNKLYTIPCDYEKVEYLWDDSFKVSKAGFTGIIGVTEEGICWKEKLHRED